MMTTVGMGPVDLERADIAITIHKVGGGLGIVFLNSSPLNERGEIEKVRVFLDRDCRGVSLPACGAVGLVPAGKVIA